MSDEIYDFPLSLLTFETKGFAFLIHLSVLRTQHSAGHIAMVQYVTQPHSYGPGSEPYGKSNSEYELQDQTAWASHCYHL